MFTNCPPRASSPATKRPPRRRRGAAAVEFAIVAPIMLLIAVGMLELGRALSVQQVLTSAAREGAREAILPGADTNSVNGVVDTYAATISKNPVNTTISPDLALVQPGDLVAVNVSSTYQPFSGFGASWLGTSFQMNAVSVMRREGFE